MGTARAVQNFIFLGLPVAAYALVVHWRSRISWIEIGGRLGLAVGNGRPYLISLAATAPMSLVAIWASSWSSGFKGSTIAPFIGAPPTPAIIIEVLLYGFVATGIPEELLFRGLIAGAIFRRTSFWKANLLQAAIFMIPHLLILVVAPSLWPLVICVPLAHGLIAGWLRQVAGSIWPAVILHAIPNVAGALSVLNWL